MRVFAIRVAAQASVGQWSAVVFPGKFVPAATGRLATVADLWKTTQDVPISKFIKVAACLDLCSTPIHLESGKKSGVHLCRLLVVHNRLSHSQVSSFISPWAPDWSLTHASTSSSLCPVVSSCLRAGLLIDPGARRKKYFLHHLGRTLPSAFH